MKIGIDARFFGPIGKGLGRYTQKLIEELEKVDTQNQYVIFLSKENFDEYQPKNPNFLKVKIDIPWYSWKEQLVFPSILIKHRCDLVHFLHFNVPVFYWKPYVVTIHDLILLEYPTRKASRLSGLMYRIKYLAYLVTIVMAAWRAKEIVAISDYTKDSIQKRLKVPANKITRIYNGVDLSVFHPLHHQDFPYENYPIINPHRFLLYVGNVYPHKNVERLLEAFQLLIQDSEVSSEISLLIVGRTDYFFERIIDYAKRLGIEDRVVFPGYLPDEQLSRLYQDCYAYVFPSLYEGFGLPPLEAMAMGAPVILSSSTCIPEVFGEDMPYMDPTDTQDMYRVLKQALLDTDFPDSQKEQSSRLLTKYSWEKMAQSMKKLYNEIRK